MLKLRSLRNERKINQLKLAMDLQISQASISKYEVGSAEPDISTIIRLAEYFNVSADFLLGVSEKRMPITESDLTDEEVEHLAVFRVLSKAQRGKVGAYMQGMLDESKS